ncbi:MAG TPA: phosphoribosylpyrophosphate synthetase [Chitinophagales bacterium]|nr:phosphoribosylpyrophosphate synthetase [Chitinophagales bacterium]
MKTVSEVINILNGRGYTADLNLKEDRIECSDPKVELLPGDFVVDKNYRFEGMSDPGDEAIVFAISSEKYNLKGVLVNGYGVSSIMLSEAMLQALTKDLGVYDSPDDDFLE